MGRSNRSTRFFNFEYAQLLPLWVSIFIDILGFTILIPLLPFYAEEYEVSTIVVGLLLSTNAIFGFICGPILAKLSDRYGRKPLLLISQTGTMIGFVMLAFSKTLPMVFLSRIIDGLFGGNYPIGKAVIGDVVPPKHRAKQMANIGVAHILSSLIGPGLGGLLFDAFGIIAPGLVAAFLSLGTILLTVFLLKESLPRKRIELGLPLLEHTKVVCDGHQHQPHVLTDKKHNPIGHSKIVRSTSLWKNRRARISLTIWAFHTFSFIIYITTISLFAKEQLGLTAREVGLTLTISGVFRLFVRFVIFVPLLNRLGQRKTLTLGLGLFIIAFILLSFVQDPIQFALVLILVSFAASCSRGPLNAFISRSVGPQDQGKISGISSSLDSFSQIIGPLFGGMIFFYFETSWFGIFIALFAAIAFVLMFRLPKYDDVEKYSHK
ncbi:MAG: MFS transporter [Promethearchaeota archaeon]